MGLIIYSLLFSIPAIIFSILSWRLRTGVMFWLGIGFTALLLFEYLYNIEFLIFIFQDIDTLGFAIFILALLGIPVYFLIASKASKSNSGDNSDVSDDYLNSIINDENDNIDYE